MMSVLVCRVAATAYPGMRCITHCRLFSGKLGPSAVAWLLTIASTHRVVNVRPPRPVHTLAASRIHVVQGSDDQECRGVHAVDEVSARRRLVAWVFLAFALLDLRALVSPATTEVMTLTSATCVISISPLDALSRNTPHLLVGSGAPWRHLTSVCSLSAP